MVFNGEIYNFLELRKELERSGHIFRTNSDTEVLLHGYRQWGSSLLSGFGACLPSHCGKLLIPRTMCILHKKLETRSRPGAAVVITLGEKSTLNFARFFICKVISIESL